MPPRRLGRPVFRDVATLCLAVLDVPNHPLVCELEADHLDRGQKHKSGCTHWGRAVDPQPKED